MLTIPPPQEFMTDIEIEVNVDVETEPDRYVNPKRKKLEELLLIRRYGMKLWDWDWEQT